MAGGRGSFDPNKTQHDGKAIYNEPPTTDTAHDEESGEACADSAKIYIKNFKKTLNPDGRHPSK